MWFWHIFQIVETIVWGGGTCQVKVLGMRCIILWWHGWGGFRFSDAMAVMGRNYIQCHWKRNQFTEIIGVLYIRIPRQKSVAENFSVSAGNIKQLWYSRILLKGSEKFIFRHKLFWPLTPILISPLNGSSSSTFWDPKKDIKLARPLFLKSDDRSIRKILTRHQ